MNMGGQEVKRRCEFEEKKWTCEKLNIQEKFGRVMLFFIAFCFPLDTFCVISV